MSTPKRRAAPQHYRPADLASGWRWSVIRRSVAALLLDACGAREIPPHWETPRSLLALQRLVFALELHWQEDCPAELSPDLLARICSFPGADLRPAQRLAVRTRTDRPTEADLLAVAADLTSLAAVLRETLKRPAAAALAEAIAGLLTAPASAETDRRQRRGGGAA